MPDCQHCEQPFSAAAKQRFCSLTCSNLARGVAGEARRRSAYALNPKQCRKCDAHLTFEQRVSNVYCSSSCSTTVNNVGQVRNGTARENRVCKSCSAAFLASTASVAQYCSMKCTHDDFRNKFRSKFENGEIISRGILKKYLVATVVYECACCKIAEWMGKPISLQLDHINGNPGNNQPDNLRLLCPNCHCQTETWGAKNKGSGRKSRGLKTN